MIKLLMIYICISIWMCGFSQREEFHDSIVKISMKTNLGIGKAPATMTYFSRKKVVEVNELGIKKEAYIFTHYYQPIQKHYREYLSGMIGKQKFDSLYSFYNIDSTELCPFQFKDYISVKVILEDDGFISVVPDQNNNGSYEDDVSFRLPLRKGSLRGLDYNTEYLPTFRIDNILYYRNKKFFTKSAYFRISTYYNWGNGEEMDSINPKNIFFEGFEFKLGKFKLGSTPYIIYLNNPVFDFYYSKSNTSLLIIRSENPIPPNFTYLTRKLLDTISLDGYTIVPVTTSDLGDTLNLKISTTRRPNYGFHQGDQLPNFRGETLDGIKIDIYKQKKGDYLLLDFFGSWCLPCIKNFPRLKLFHDNYSKFNFKIVGIANEIDSSFSMLKKLISKEKVVWEIIKQSRSINFDIIQRSGVKSYPTYLLISPENKIIFEGSADSLDYLEDILAGLFKRR